MTRYQIEVVIDGERHYLDTYDDQAFELNFNIADITNLDQSKSSYSKTITIPETGHNREIFGFISDLNASSSFNQNLKSRAYVLIDSIIVFQGYIQLKSVTQDRDNNFNKLNCVIYADNANLFTNVGEKYLTDLDMEEYNHIWDITSITQSWSNDWQSGYYYGLVDYGWDWGYSNLQVLDTNEFYPLTYIKTIWNKIFQEAGGYTYESNFLNSPRFENLLLSFNRTGLSLSSGVTSSQINDFTFTIGMTQSQPTGPFSIQGENTFTASFADESSPFGDPNNLWNTSTYQYTAPQGDIGQRFGMFLEVIIDETLSVNPVGLVTFRLRREFDPATGLPIFGGYLMMIYNGTNELFVNAPGTPFLQTTISPGVTNYQFSFYTDYLNSFDVDHTPLFAGEKVWLEIVRFMDSNTSLAPNAVLLVDNSFIFNELVTTGNSTPAFPGSTINYQLVLPDKIKQKDFLTSIIKMFNLYIEQNPLVEKQFIIEPRNDYYAAGTIVDWSQKLDLKVNIQEDFLSDKQKRNNIFRYKEDKDILNIKYRNTYNANYGEYFYIFENDFTNGEKIIEPLFSPTPLVKVENSIEIVLPKIVSDGNNLNNNSSITPHNPRVFQKNVNGVVALNYDHIKVGGTQYNYYPYVGHFDTPLNPTQDINFGQTKAIGYDAGNGLQIDGVNDNLFSTYWEKMILEINDRDARFVTANFWLTPKDIAQFRFNHKVFIDGQYYRVDKIVGYNPSDQNTTTQVKLIKARDITINSNNKTNLITSGYVNIGPVTKIPYSDFSNVISSGKGAVFGLTNSIGHGSQKHIVLGDLNNVGSPKTLIVGDGNRLPYGSPKLKIIGNDNQADVGIENTTVIGDSYIVHDSNRVVVSQPFILNPNIVSAGRDIVINPYQEIKIPNFISGSRDAVREIGSFDIVSIISAGRDSVL